MNIKNLINSYFAEYPTPVVNLIRDEPAFTREAVGASVLKVLNDFRGWAYQMAQMPGTAITVRENLTEIWLPKLGLDEVRSLVESNRNMIGWAIPELGPAELEMEVNIVWEGIIKMEDDLKIKLLI